MKDYAAWLALMILAIILIVTGFTGSFARMLACIFTPSIVIENTEIGNF